MAASLAAAAASVHAQSQQVVIFGNVDLNVTYARAGSSKAKVMDQGGNRVPSRIGFRGIEDLGDGLSAGFWLESAILPDTGATQGGFWGRRSTVSLAHRSYGEIRLGRDYVPSFYNLSTFTPFGTVGAAGISNIVAGWGAGLGGASTQLRANNMIAYHFSQGRGVYGQVARALAENVNGAGHTGGRLGYSNGTIDVAAAYGETKVSTVKYKTSTIGGTYSHPWVRVFANYYDQKVPNNQQTIVSLGAAVPVGVGQFVGSVARADRKGTGIADNDASMAAIGYIHSLSKRTELYSTYSSISNSGNAAFSATEFPAGQAGKRSSALQLGLTHRF